MGIALSRLEMPLFALMDLLVVGAVVLLLAEARQNDVADRVQQVMSNEESRDPASRSVGRFLVAVRRIGGFLQSRTRMFSAAELAGFEQSLALAGLNPRRNLPLLLGVKAMATVAMPLLAFILGRSLGYGSHILMIMVAIGFVIGLRGPFMIVRVLRRPYLNAIRRGIPDGFDLLVICAEAGVGLESALDRVATILRRTNLPTASQLAKLAEELRTMPDQHKALSDFGRKSGVDGMQRFTTILSQSLQFGTPLAQALRMVAAELRRERANRLEGRASRLPVLLIFPLLFFIMPCIMIVMVGPSVITLFHALGQLRTGFK